MWRALSLIAKVVASGSLLYLALRWVDFNIVVNRLSRINLYWFLLEVLVLTVQVFFLSLRWREIVQLCNGALSLARSFRYSMIAMFFNQTLPSGLGGDAARIMLLARQGEGWRIAAYSVLVDRVVGIMALAIIVIGCLPWTLVLIRNPIGRATLLVIGLGCFFAGLVFIGLGWAQLKFMQRWTVTRHLANAASIVWRAALSARSGGTIAANSILIHMLTVFAAWCGAKSIGAPLSFLQALFLVPPVLLISTVPISIAGWGIRESAMVLAFAYVGLAQNDGLLVSLLSGVSAFIVGAFGGLIWILGNERRSTQLSTELENSST